MAHYDPHAMQHQHPQQHVSFAGAEYRPASLWASAAYCFIDFVSPEAAANAINTVNGTIIPGTNKWFKLNWASGSNAGSGGSAGNEYSVFVGDLSPEVTEQMLLDDENENEDGATFQQAYGSIRSAKIMIDPNTGISRGYGFVRFGDESEQIRSLQELQGIYCGSRPMRLSVATPKPRQNNNAINNNNNMHVNVNAVPAVAPVAGYGYNSPVQPSFQSDAYNQYSDPNNTTVFIGGLTGVVHEDELRAIFGVYGEISYVKIPPGKGCGFVQYVHRQSAEMAIGQLNGYQIGMSRVRLSWGRAQYEPKPSHFGSGYGGQHGGSNRGYGGYNSYMHSGSDSNMSLGTSGGGGFYSNERDSEKSSVERRNRAYVEQKEGIHRRLDEHADWRRARATGR
ncbi:hypothetical protein BGZ94_007045 [Podila epigama]|nr:hypothetical protein BGZ94_007045 [Podila epigama]